MFFFSTADGTRRTYKVVSITAAYIPLSYMTWAQTGTRREDYTARDREILRVRHEWWRGGKKKRSVIFITIFLSLLSLRGCYSIGARTTVAANNWYIIIHNILHNIRYETYRRGFTTPSPRVVYNSNIMYVNNGPCTFYYVTVMEILVAITDYSA